MPRFGPYNHAYDCGFWYIALDHKILQVAINNSRGSLSALSSQGGEKTTSIARTLESPRSGFVSDLLLSLAQFHNCLPDFLYVSSKFRLLKILPRVRCASMIVD
jgi:hypothetical protein